MTRYTVDIDLGSLWATPERCPGCGELGLAAVADGIQTNFECRSCKQIWHIELGWATPVGGPECRPSPGHDAMSSQPDVGWRGCASD